MTRIFVVEKYAIARDATPFEKDAQARDATLFWRRAPGSVSGHPIFELCDRISPRKIFFGLKLFLQIYSPPRPGVLILNLYSITVRSAAPQTTLLLTVHMGLRSNLFR